MRPLQRLSIVLLACLATYSTAVAQIIAPVSCKVTIEGTSNVHDWDEEVQKVTATARVSRNDEGTITIGALSVVMDVYSIKSSRGKIMDNNTYKALKAAKYPEIRFALATPVRSLNVNDGAYNFKAKGNITIAGVTRLVDMNVRLVSKDGNLAFEGSQKIKMTDYNVTPPTVMMGAMKTGNEITVRYNIVFIETAITANF